MLQFRNILRGLKSLDLRRQTGYLATYAERQNLLSKHTVNNLIAIVVVIWHLKPTPFPYQLILLSKKPPGQVYSYNCCFTVIMYSRRSILAA